MRKSIQGTVQGWDGGTTNAGKSLVQLLDINMDYKYNYVWLHAVLSYRTQQLGGLSRIEHSPPLDDRLLFLVVLDGSVVSC